MIVLVASGVKKEAKARRGLLLRCQKRLCPRDILTGKTTRFLISIGPDSNTSNLYAPQYSLTEDVMSYCWETRFLVVGTRGEFSIYLEKQISWLLRELVSSTKKLLDPKQKKRISA